MKTDRLILISTLAAMLLLGHAAGCADDKTAADSSTPDAVADALQSDLHQQDQTPAEAALPDLTLVDGQQPDLGAVTPHQWITLQPGTFTMGSPKNEMCREPDTARETQHVVTLTHAFELSVTEVTQGQFHSLMWYNPSKFPLCGEACPVEQVSWNEAAAYCNVLSVSKGLTPCYSCKGSGPKITCAESAAHDGAKIFTCPGYRLPTEAEWEWAYRAGTTTPYYNGKNVSCLDSDAAADKIGWYKKNSGGKSHVVAQKAPNSRGLYDMPGSVWEWCHDWFQIDLGSKAAIDPWGSTQHNYRLIRGGSWFGFARNLRAARRLQKSTTYTCHGIGFRLARTVKGSATADAGAD